MSEKEIFEKVNEIRKTRIIDIYLEEEFKGEGIVVNTNGNVCFYTWRLGLCIESNKAKQLYSLEEFNIDINNLNIVNISFNNTSSKCINIIEFKNIKLENNDPNLYKNLKEQVMKLKKV